MASSAAEEQPNAAEKPNTASNGQSMDGPSGRAPLGGPAMLAAPRSGPPVSNAPPSFRSNTVVISPSPLAARLKKDSGSQKPPAGTSAGLAVTVALAFLALALALFTPPVSAAIVKRQAQIAVPGTCLNSSKISNGLLNRLEPPPGYKPMMGFGLDWLNDTAAKIDSRLGRRPSVIGGWVKIFPNQTWQDWNLYKMAMQVANAPRPPGSAPPILMVALMPVVDFRGKQFPINLTVFHNISQNLARVNYEFGVPVFLRFCHEMNGWWPSYGQQPVDFVRVWRQFVPILRNYTNMTAMLWAPNIGESYPFMGYALQTDLKDPNSIAMDTNRDGVIDSSDDAYTPYWPGSQYVDWVGISSYYQGGPEWALNSFPEDNRFDNSIKGIFQYNPIPYNFHDMFAKRYNKPMAIPETGARYYPRASTGPGDGEVAIKRNWWNQVFNATLSGDWDHLKMVCWFEEAKEEGGASVDYAVTYNPLVRRALLLDLPYETLQWADNITYSCDGQIVEVENKTDAIGPSTWVDPQPQFDIPEDVWWPRWEARPTPATPIIKSTTTTSTTTTATPTSVPLMGLTATALEPVTATTSLTIVSETPTTGSCETRNCPELRPSNGHKSTGALFGAAFAGFAVFVTFIALV